MYSVPKVSMSLLCENTKFNASVIESSSFIKTYRNDICTRTVLAIYKSWSNYLQQVRLAVMFSTDLQIPHEAHVTRNRFGVNVC